MTAGAWIQAGASLLGGALGRRNERKMAKESSGWALTDTVNTAKKLGIHPLSALGTVSPYQSSNPLSVGVANAGAAINEGMANKARKKENEAILASQVRVNDTQAELNAARSRTEAMEQRRIANELANYSAGSAGSGAINYYGADPLSTRPEEARIKEGPNRGRYAYMINGTIYITGDTSPQALFEELKGSTVGEVTSLFDTITQPENYRGIPVVDVEKLPPKKKPEKKEPHWMYDPRWAQ